PLKDDVVGVVYLLLALLPTNMYVRRQGARVVLLSLLGRPRGKVDPQYSLRPIAQALEALLGAPVTFLEDPTSDNAVQQVRHLPRGGVALAENTRFHAGEEANDGALADRFAALGTRSEEH